MSTTKNTKPTTPQVSTKVVKVAPFVATDDMVRSAQPMTREGFSQWEKSPALDQIASAAQYVRTVRTDADVTSGRFVRAALIARPDLTGRTLATLLDVSTGYVSQIRTAIAAIVDTMGPDVLATEQASALVSAARTVLVRDSADALTGTVAKVKRAKDKPTAWQAAATRAIGVRRERAQAAAKTRQPGGTTDQVAKSATGGDLVKPEGTSALLGDIERLVKDVTTAKGWTLAEVGTALARLGYAVDHLKSVKAALTATPATVAARTAA